MTKTIAELEQIATDCMESTDPNVAQYHRGAAAAARAAATAEHPGARHFNQGRECEQLVAAVEYHENRRAMAAEELTTAERLLVAAMIAARANEQELELGAAAELLEAGDALADALEDALETHIYEPGEVPPESAELLAVERWKRLRELTDQTVAPYDVHAARLKAEGYRLSSDLDRRDVYRKPGGARAWINYQGGDDRFTVTRAQLEGDGSLQRELELGRAARGELEAVQA